MPNGDRGERPWWEKALDVAFPPYRAISPFVSGEMFLPWQQPAQAAPAPPAQLAPRAYETLATLTPEERARLPYPIPEEPLGQQIARRKRAEEEAARVAAELGKPKPTPPQPTEAPPAGFRWAFDRDLNRWVPQFVAKREEFPAPPGAPPTDAFGRTATWSTRLGQWDYPPNWGQRPGDQPAPPPPISPYQQQEFGLLQQQMAQQQAQQQQQFGLQEQQFAAGQQQFQQQLQFQQAQAQAAQEEQERQYMSQLAAQPINWLQYAAYTGQPPVVQPWMQPLGFQEAEGALPPGVEVGQPIPGFQGQAGQQGQQTFAGLPQLRTPSAQLQARWGPTAQAQFLGYRQARTGATPEETQFRLGAQRAPTGRFGGFSRFR